MDKYCDIVILRAHCLLSTSSKGKTDDLMTIAKKKFLYLSTFVYWESFLKKLMQYFTFFKN